MYNIEKKKKVIIIGAGGFAKQVIEIFEIYNIHIIGLLDDIATTPLYGYPILGTINSINKYKNIYYFCAIGDVSIREKIFKLTDKWINCIHPTANISLYSQLGIGNYIGPNVCIMQDVVIGNNNIIDPLSVVSHDVKIGNHNHIASQSCLLGKVIIKKCNLIGANSTVLPKIMMGSYNILGAGAVLTKTIKDNNIMIGIPAKNI